MAKIYKITGTKLEFMFEVTEKDADDIHKRFISNWRMRDGDIALCEDELKQLKEK